ncbi:MAG: hypothetical protein HYZ44_14965 [Bacteroidetes bacterium]|nr:hypothetical protein [Bacteroidota bacterium]
MDVKTKHIEFLLEALSEKTGQPFDKTGFAEMTEQIGSIGERYLYENLHLAKKNAMAEGQAVLNLQQAKLDLIAKFLGYKNYRLFAEHLDNPVDKVLLGLIGTYYSYVRKNEKVGTLFRSPVSITNDQGKISMNLKGPKWNFKGEVVLKNGCLFILLKSDGGKMIHHVYKIGVRESPNLLQGIFSGVSTAFDPIGGRAILVRSESEWTALTNAELRVADLKKSRKILNQRLAAYFSSYEKNNLSINKIVSFSVEDLH